MLRRSWLFPQTNCRGLRQTELGNAIGDSIASQSTQGQGPWSSADYRNGSDVESDNFNPASAYGYRNGSDIESDAFRPAMAYGYRNGSDVESDNLMAARELANNRTMLNAVERLARPEAYMSIEHLPRVTVSGVSQATLENRSETQRLLNRAAADASDKPVWSFREASMARRKLNDLVDAQSQRFLGGSGSTGEIRSMSAVEGFLTFNPVGRFMNGWGNAATEILKSPYTIGKEALFMVGDAVGNGTFAAMNWALGGNQSHQNDSALGRSLETNGVLGTIGLATRGAVLSLPGIAQIDAINRRDWGALGESGPGTLLAAAGLSYRPASTLYNYGDHLRPVLGPATLSHPEELASILSRAEEMGIGVRYEVGRLAYEPALRSGTPGTLILDPDASIGALRHEWRHALDNADLGHPGFRLMADSDAFWWLEYRGYMEEIRLARETRNFDAGRKIVGEMRTRRGEILGY